MTSDTLMPDGSDWKHEIHGYIDSQFEKFNEANQQEFQALRDGQLRLEAGQKQLSNDVAQVLAASATAHKEIIERLERLENK